MKNKKLKGILPVGSYQEIADAIKISKGTVAQYFSNVESRVSPETELAILEQAEKILKGRVLTFIQNKKAAVKKKIADKAALAA